MIISRNITNKAWSDFVLNHPDGNYFQSPEAFDFFRSVDNHEPFIFVCLDDDEIIGLLCGVIISSGKGIKNVFSKRAIIWGGPLIRNDSNALKTSECLELLLKELCDYSKKETIYTEFRNFADMSKYNEIFKNHGYNFNKHSNYLVNIDNSESVWKRISESKRRQIKKGFETGARIEEAINADDVRDYYNILKNIYLVKVKKPLAELSFFKKLFENKDNAKFLFVKYQEKIIGGIVCIIYKETISEWYICGLDKDYKNQYPSVLATYAPIQFALNNGLKCFDFMGAGRTDEDYGVRDFKAKFGGDLVDYGRYFRVNKPLFFKIGKAGLKLLNK